MYIFCPLFPIKICHLSAKECWLLRCCVVALRGVALRSARAGKKKNSNDDELKRRRTNQQTNQHNAATQRSDTATQQRIKLSNAATQRRSNAATQRRSDAATQRSDTATQQRSNAAMQQRNNAATQQRNNAATRQRNNAATLQCSNKRRVLVLSCIVRVSGVVVAVRWQCYCQTCRVHRSRGGVRRLVAMLRQAFCGGADFLHIYFAANSHALYAPLRLEIYTPLLQALRNLFQFRNNATTIMSGSGSGFSPPLSSADFERPHDPGPQTL